MKIIGIAGDARAGKDTTAKFIAKWVEERGGTVLIRSFARKLKISAARALGFDGTEDECIEFCETLKHTGTITVNIGDGFIFFSITGREYLQFYGTEAHRDVFDEEFWVDALFAEFKGAGFGDGPVLPDVLVIPDARFPNEGKAVKRKNGTGLEILRPENPDALKGGEALHTSENGMPREYINYLINNVGDLADLENQVGLFCEAEFPTA